MLVIFVETFFLPFLVFFFQKMKDSGASTKSGGHGVVREDGDRDVQVWRSYDGHPRSP